LGHGDTVELFDDAGHVASGTIGECDANHVVVRIEKIQTDTNPTKITIASAVPKGDRADWMIEKLSELGVARFIPLATARSVVLPSGQNKRDRWMRIATESAKQSRRTGVMQIEQLTPLDELIKWVSSGIYLSTAPDAAPLASLSSFRLHPSSLMLVGPEGGWTDQEVALMDRIPLTGAKLTGTILRVETAAVTAAAVIACLQNSQGL
jgi:16S rRNA (uracil1498-N3)-methyltransferase